MEKIKLEILGLSPSQSQAGSFALVLGEEYGNRRLPIIIGMFEAQAIAIEIEKIQPNRPMTHDLFKSFAKAFNYTVNEIVISDLREGIFYARLYCSSTDGLRDTVIDARPSDAIAIALRFNVPLYTYETILSEAGIVSGVQSDSDDIEEVMQPVKPRSLSDQIKNMSLDELQRMLAEALNNEEYEKAAKIRDEIARRN
ncbi:MAG: bifunctional nuclease domain-containing protein [Runella sp.]